MGFLSSSIGKKYVMGLAGAGWTLFVLGHMAGNLLIFAGAEYFNKYGHAIVSNKPLLYGTEAFLIICLLVHVSFGINLTLKNKAAKPQKYAVGASTAKKSSWASSFMAIQGSLILAFIIYHIMTFKYGPVYWVEYDGVKMRDLFRLVSESFQDPMYVGVYLVCLSLLGLHLSHGVSSIFQSLGFNHPRYTPTLKKVGFLYAVIVVGGFIAQPIYLFLFM